MSLIENKYLNGIDIAKKAVLILGLVALLMTVVYWIIGAGEENPQALKDVTHEEEAMMEKESNLDPRYNAKPMNVNNIDKNRQIDGSLGRVPMRVPAKGFFIHVDKSDHILKLYKDGKLYKAYNVAVGKGTGDKGVVGDNRTPEGNFYITKIEESSRRLWDEGDGLKPVYGPWFLRLQTGTMETFSGKAWTGFGIHGTIEPETIGTHASQGCIRLTNDMITDLKETIEDAFDAGEKIYVVIVP